MLVYLSYDVKENDMIIERKHLSLDLNIITLATLGYFTSRGWQIIEYKNKEEKK